MIRALIAFCIAVSLFSVPPDPLLALDDPELLVIAGQEADLFVSGAHKPTLILWHQFDSQTALGIDAGRDSWDELLASERGESLKARYNILVLDHPWRNTLAALGFERRQLSAFVFAIHHALGRRGLKGAVFTMGASAGGSLAILHCAMTPRVCEGAVAIGAFYRFAEENIARLAVRDCFGGKRLLALNSPADGMASLQEHIRENECENIETLAPADGDLHGMAWLYAQPDDGAVWQRIDAYFEIGGSEPAAFKGG